MGAEFWGVLGFVHLQASLEGPDFPGGSKASLKLSSATWGPIQVANVCPTSAAGQSMTGALPSPQTLNSTKRRLLVSRLRSAARCPGGRRVS